MMLQVPPAFFQDPDVPWSEKKVIQADPDFVYVLGSVLRIRIFLGPRIRNRIFEIAESGLRFFRAKSDKPTEMISFNNIQI